MSRDRNNTEKSRSDINSSGKKYDYSPVTTDIPIPESLPELLRERKRLAKNSEDNQLSQEDHDSVKDLVMILSGNGQFDFSQTMIEKILESYCQPRRQNDKILKAQEIALREKTSKLLDMGITYEIIKILDEKEALKFITREIKDILGMDSRSQAQGQPEINSETSQNHEPSKNSSEYLVNSIQDCSGNGQQNNTGYVSPQIDLQGNKVTTVHGSSESSLNIVTASSQEKQYKRPFQEGQDVTNLHNLNNNVSFFRKGRAEPVSKKQQQGEEKSSEFNLSEVDIVIRICDEKFGGAISSARRHDIFSPVQKNIMKEVDSTELNTQTLQR